ncbi:hypothetical protein PFISCL1PPCAC_1631, partial [Pristionchus fissidentatus]
AKFSLLKGAREAHSLVANVVDVAELTDERVAEDPGGTESASSEGLHGERALGLICCHRDDHVLVVDGVRLGTDDQVEGGDRCCAIDHVHTECLVEHGIRCCREFLYYGQRSVDEGCAGVRDDLPSLCVLVVAHSNAGELELEVGGGGERLVGNHRAAVGGVDRSICEEATVDVLLRALVLQPDGEEGQINQV